MVPKGALRDSPPTTDKCHSCNLLLCRNTRILVQERIIQAICEAFVDALGFAEAGTMIEVVLNDRLGKKVRVKCNQDDTIGDLKKLVAAQTGTRPEKIRIQKWYTIYKDHITLGDYEIHDGMGLELYYN